MSADRVRNRFNQSINTSSQSSTANQTPVPKRVSALLSHFSICLAKKEGVPMMSGQYITELSMYAGCKPIIGGKEVQVLKHLVYNLSEIENLGVMIASAKSNYLS